MRILHVLDHSLPLRSGYAFRTHWILENQAANGLETFPLTTPKHTLPYVPREEVDGRTYFRTPPLPELARRVPVLGECVLMRRTARRLREVAAEVRPDVIHAHSPVLNAIPSIRVGRALDIPVVYEIRAFWEDAAVSHGTCREGGPRYRVSRWLETRALRRADAVIAICDGVAGDVVARGIPVEKVTVVPNAANVVDAPLGDRGDPDLVRQLELAGRTVLGFLGSFYAYEGLMVLVRALPLIVAECPDAILLLVGGGPDEGRLRAEVERLDLAPHVRFTGWVPHGEMRRYHGVVDVLVFPRESMRLTDLVTPMKPLEGLAHGKIVLASDVGGHREIIRDGDTGTLFPAGDHRELARAVVHVLGQRDRWAEQGRRARAFIETERSWPIVVERYAEVYDRIREVV